MPNCQLHSSCVTLSISYIYNPLSILPTSYIRDRSSYLSIYKLYMQPIILPTSYIYIYNLGWDEIFHFILISFHLTEADPGPGLAVKARLSTTYHSETDDQRENTNMIIKQYLQIFCSYLQNNLRKMTFSY
jgi:hypothetical protein